MNYDVTNKNLKFEETKGVISSCKSKDAIQWKKDNRTNNNLQNTTQKTKD